MEEFVSNPDKNLGNRGTYKSKVRRHHGQNLLILYRITTTAKSAGAMITMN